MRPRSTPCGRRAPTSRRRSDRPRTDGGEVGSGLGLGEQLAGDEVGAQHRAHVARPLLVGVPTARSSGATSCWVTENISVRRGTSNAVFLAPEGQRVATWAGRGRRTRPARSAHPSRRRTWPVRSADPVGLARAPRSAVQFSKTATESDRRRPSVDCGAAVPATGAATCRASSVNSVEVGQACAVQSWRLSLSDAQRRCRR